VALCLLLGVACCFYVSGGDASSLPVVNSADPVGALSNADLSHEASTDTSPTVDGEVPPKENLADTSVVLPIDPGSKGQEDQDTTVSLPADPGPSEYRLWTDSTGKFRVMAKLLSFANGTVFLEQESGKNVAVLLERLSDADQAYVRGL